MTDSRLNRILKWRIAQCELEKAMLTQLSAELGKLDTAIERLRTDCKRVQRGVMDSGSISGADLASMDGYLNGAARQQQALAVRRQQRMQQLQDQRGRVIIAERRVKLLEKLRERQVRELLVQSRREMDNLASESFLSQICRARITNRAG